MADNVDFRDVFPAQDESATVGLTTLTNWLGAIVSLSLMIGLGFWGYKLAMRDVTGVPVVRAMAGPMRIQPDDPGGEVVAYQGLAVNRVQSKGSVAPPAERVVLAPPPVKLDGNEDLTVAQLERKQNTAVAHLDEKPKNVADVSSSATDTEINIEDAIRLAMKETVPVKKARKLATLKGVKGSVRPKLRPRSALAANTPLGLLPKAKSPPATPVSTPIYATASVSPDQIAPGTSLVQLGAFNSRDMALREWRLIRERNRDLIGNRREVILKATSGGRPFYRLRMIGFRDIEDSRRLCTALVARGTPCIPVIAR
ncbi:MAG: SPOR domain-containing protein [Paracoccaceae bacterium]|nr:SPOR domain-containing protein [Paracoccaceae bacterium]